MINIFPKLSKSSAGAPASPGAAARRGAGRGRGVPRPGCGTHEPFWSSQLELAGWTRRAGSPREDRRTASGPGERKMKVLLVLTMLFACSAACSEPAATPGWQRGGAAWDPCSPSPCPGQGSPPAAPGRAASEAPAGASGRRGCAGPGSARPGPAPPPRRVPGGSRALLRQNLPVRKHLRAERRRDGASSPGESPPRGFSASRRGEEASGQGHAGSGAALT
ncbi:translation initiation factor IF-2-like isoform X2 [Passer montanus]|uniref:translation initiation factor IF-2-like isoform X2 n=1 Tax=Passer montanus TaxID=9160 RepID=UPI0019611215|nr:translation initiation factor IF-2-like isoform X2 [Passer montanus]